MNTLKLKKSAIPYIEEILQKMQERDPVYSKTFSRHIHYGFWKETAEQVRDLSESGTIQAMDELLIQISKIAGIRDGMAIVDAGCGFGGFINDLDRKHQGLRLVGINIDERQIEYAKKMCGSGRGSNTIQILNADVAATGLEANSMDRVIAIESAFHFPSRLNFLKEACRILKPGGQIIITEVFFDYSRLPQALLDLIANLDNVIQFEKSLGKFNASTTLDDYRKMAPRCGLSLDLTEDWSQNVVSTFKTSKRLHPHSDANHKGTGLYSHRLLDFGEKMMRHGFTRYHALLLTKVG